MCWEEFVYWLRRGLSLVLTVWQMVVISAIVAALMAAPIALLQLLCKALARA